MAMSFPYPVNGEVRRPTGQGCTSCTHSPYCPAAYWYRRYTFRDLEPQNGVACTSWSTTPAAPPAPTPDDEAEAEYIYRQGTGSEPNRCGLGASTGSDSRS